MYSDYKYCKHSLELYQWNWCYRCSYSWFFRGVIYRVWLPIKHRVLVITTLWLFHQWILRSTNQIKHCVSNKLRHRIPKTWGRTTTSSNSESVWFKRDMCCWVDQWVLLNPLRHPTVPLQNHWKSRLTDTTVQWKVRPSEAKGRGFDPRQPHQIDTFPITPLFSGFVCGLELDSLYLATLRSVIWPRVGLDWVDPCCPSFGCPVGRFQRSLDRESLPIN